MDTVTRAAASSGAWAEVVLLPVLLLLLLATANPTIWSREPWSRRATIITRTTRSIWASTLLAEAPNITIRGTTTSISREPTITMTIRKDVMPEIAAHRPIKAITGSKRRRIPLVTGISSSSSAAHYQEVSTTRMVNQLATRLTSPTAKNILSSNNPPWLPKRCQLRRRARRESHLKSSAKCLSLRLPLQQLQVNLPFYRKRRLTSTSRPFTKTPPIVSLWQPTMKSKRKTR